jgi:hypothetical protein
MFLQVEVKASAAADTSYDLLDYDTSDETSDRLSILSVPFAQNADLLDQRDVGTGSGSIPLLETGGLLPVSTIPGGTNADTFTLDSDNSTGGTITLQFGETLSKQLSYDQGDGRFEFNDDVYINGDLTTSGLINGVDLSTLTSSSDSHLLVSSGAGLTFNVAAGGYRISGTTTNYAGDSGIALTDDATIDCKWQYRSFGGSGNSGRSCKHSDRSSCDTK